MQPCVQRDLSFWRAVAEHPQVAPALRGQSFETIAPLFHNPQVLPLATENGGLIFIAGNGFGSVWELHTLYKPEGWGREVLFAAKACFARLFGQGAELIYTHERCGLWRTRPPKSFGFKPCGEPFAPPDTSEKFQLWTLTRGEWEASPANVRANREIH